MIVWLSIASFIHTSFLKSGETFNLIKKSINLDKMLQNFSIMWSRLLDRSVALLICATRDHVFLEQLHENYTACIIMFVSQSQTFHQPIALF